MTPERWRRALELFDAALQREQSEWHAFFASSCADDEELARAVQSLLDAHREAAGFGSTSVISAGLQLAPASSFGAYRIEHLLATGGMGEVYRARDTQLNRDVALKVLPRDHIEDPERSARFEREAQILAGLNHPNIATIHEVEEHGSARAIVMELVEGMTLAERIAQGPIAVDETLLIATQIAEALEVAHEQGIVHRDLKPANIKIRPDGKVKVLDFGLASIRQTHADRGVPQSGFGDAADTGLVLGTAAYMSPEQVRGVPVDRRTDVWAFGCVLYEMLTARRAFASETVGDTLVSVLSKEPDWTVLPPQVPPAIRSLIERCLAKDRHNRISHIAVLRFAIGETLSVKTPKLTTRRGWFAAVLATGLASLVIAGAFAFRGRVTPTDTETQRVFAGLPDGMTLAYGWSPGGSLAISPDGRRLAYLAARFDALLGQQLRLVVRSVSSLAVHELPDTDAARQPFFSPDGQSVAFFTQKDLRRVSIDGGRPVTIVENINGAWACFGIWLDDNSIVFGGSGTGGLQRVSAEGGAVKQLTKLDQSKNENGHYPTSFVNDAEAVLFNVRILKEGFRRLEAVVLSSGERRTVLEDAWGYLAGRHLLFFRDGAGLVAPFDRANLVAGSGVPITDEVRHVQQVPQLSVSQNGQLAYVPASSEKFETMGLVSRDGSFQSLRVMPGRISRPRVSPSGTQVAFDRQEAPGSSIFLFDLIRETTTKLTQSGWEAQIAWRPDGKAVAVSRARPDDDGIFVKELDGKDRLLFHADRASLRPESWSADGSILAFTFQRSGEHDIWLTTTGDKPRAWPFISSPAMEFSPVFGANGRWIAYVSNESGPLQVYVRAYPEGRPLQVSNGGGSNPVWSRDGREIFYTTSTPNGSVMAVPVTDRRGTLTLGNPKRVLNLNGTDGINVVRYLGGDNGGAGYDILPDGRLVMVRAADSPVRAIVFVESWFKELDRLAPRR